MAYDNPLACTFAEFKLRCKELIDAQRAGLQPHELENGLKMVGLSYLNISDFDAPSVSVQAPIALRLTLQTAGALPPLPGMSAAAFLRYWQTRTSHPYPGSATDLPTTERTAP